MNHGQGPALSHKGIFQAGVRPHVENYVIFTLPKRACLMGARPYALHFTEDALAYRCIIKMNKVSRSAH